MQKTLDFSKFMVYPHGKGERGLSQCRHFVNKWQDLFFAILCGRLLCTVPNKLNHGFLVLLFRSPWLNALLLCWNLNSCIDIFRIAIIKGL